MFLLGFVIAAVALAVTTELVARCWIRWKGQYSVHAPRLRQRLEIDQKAWERPTFRHAVEEEQRRSSLAAVLPSLVEWNARSALLFPHGGMLFQMSS